VAVGEAAAPTLALLIHAGIMEAKLTTCAQQADNPSPPLLATKRKRPSAGASSGCAASSTVNFIDCFSLVTAPSAAADPLAMAALAAQAALPL
jgi:hypothetical protein